MIVKTFLAGLYGVIFGVANIIPGVSGGTMMVVFGCYDIVVSAVASDIKSIRKNADFLIPFVIGAAAGIVGLSFAVSYLFDNYPIPSYLFFIGLVLGGIPFIVRKVLNGGKPKLKYIFGFAAACTVIVSLGIKENSNETEAFSLTQTPSPDNSAVTVVKLKNNTTQVISGWVIEFSGGEVEKSGGAKFFYNEGLLEKISSVLGAGEGGKEPNAFSGAEGKEEIEPKKSVTFTYVSKAGVNLKLTPQISYKADAEIILRIMMGAFLAGAAMIIPGISASFIMVLLGIYTTVIGALKDFNLIVILPAVIGIPLGIIIGARLLKYLLGKYYTAVYCVILGLALGSVFILFPQGMEIGAQMFIGLGAMLIGAAISLTAGMERRSNEDLKKVSKNLK